MASHWNRKRLVELRANGIINQFQYVLLIVIQRGFERFQVNFRRLNRSIQLMFFYYFGFNKSNGGVFNLRSLTQQLMQWNRVVFRQNYGGIFQSNDFIKFEALVQHMIYVGFEFGIIFSKI